MEEDMPIVVGKFQIEQTLSLVSVVINGIITNQEEKNIDAIKSLLPIIDDLLKRVKNCDTIITTTN